MRGSRGVGVSVSGVRTRRSRTTSQLEDLAPEAPVDRYAWYALFVLALTYTANIVDKQIIGVLAQDIKRELHVSDADLGFLYGTAFAVFYAVFGIVMGQLADRVRRTRLLSVGLALWSAMTLLSGLSRSGVQLAAARVGVGIGEATSAPCAMDARNPITAAGAEKLFGT